MLVGIDPLLSGELLLILDQMGHSDSIVVADAHFPAVAIGRRVINVPGVGSPTMLRAVLSVIPQDGTLELMGADELGTLSVQSELAAEAGIPVAEASYLDRATFYRTALEAFAVIRTGEIRPFANAIVRKGVIG